MRNTTCYTRILIKEKVWDCFEIYKWPPPPMCRPFGPHNSWYCKFKLVIDKLKVSWNKESCVMAISCELGIEQRCCNCKQVMSPASLHIPLMEVFSVLRTGTHAIETRLSARACWCWQSAPDVLDRMSPAPPAFQPPSLSAPKTGPSSVFAPTRWRVTTVIPILMSQCHLKIMKRNMVRVGAEFTLASVFSTLYWGLHVAQLAY